MPEIITSPNNDRLKAVALLQNRKKARDEQGLFVIEGVRIVEDAIISAFDRIKDVYVGETFFNTGGLERLKSSAGQRRDSQNVKETKAALEPDVDKLPVTVVSDNAFFKISETVSPQGVLAVVKKHKATVSEILQRGFDREDSQTSKDGLKRLLILDDIQDPGNLGTMMRTAEAAGMDGVIMSRGTVDIYSPKTVRSTMGSVFRVPFAYAEDLPDTLEQLKKEDFTVYGTCIDGAEPYDRVSYDGKTAIVIGNEGNGISDDVRKIIDHNIFIPMSGSVESLNAAVAAAIVMYRCRTV